MHITDIHILLTEGSDELILNTDLPSGIWPYTGTAFVSMDIASGGGEAYVAEHFPGVPYKITNVCVSEMRHQYPSTTSIF